MRCVGSTFYVLKRVTYGIKVSNYLLLLNKKTNLSLLLNIKLRTSHVAKTLTLPSISTSPCSIEGK